MANTLREDRHISNDLMISFVARTHPRIARLFYGLCHLAGALLLALIVWYVLPILKSNYEGDFYLGTPGLAEVRVWPFMLAVLLGALATATQYAILAWREFRRALVGEAA
jgi:TRAP-type C4-dicarboxylate transport system permease small subunit